MSADRRSPVVYGDPGQVEVLLDSVARVMALEPMEVFADAGVMRSLRRFSALALRRIAEASSGIDDDVLAQGHHGDQVAS
jgi:hypothetical protein